VFITTKTLSINDVNITEIMLTAFRKQNWKILLGCFFVSLNPL